MKKKIDYYSKKIQKSARLGEYWYDEIWKHVDKCPFCDLKEKYIVKEEGKIVLTVNLFPYIDYHLLIIPRKHLISLDELGSSDWKNVISLLHSAEEYFSAVGIDAYNFFIREGKHRKKTVKHLHFHVIPFQENLEKWQYQKIGVAPVDAAQRLRDVFSKEES